MSAERIQLRNGSTSYGSEQGQTYAPLSTKSTFCYLDVVSVNEELLTVRETAKRLGVHENTVRNWSQNGALDATRLPGSRFLRFRPSDVEALIAQRNSRIPTLLSERRAVSPELVTANQLKQWPVARSRDAQERFPELIRRLLIETPGFSNISIRAGDGIALEGFDGVADSLGTKFLPAGKLVFEFGVNERPESKATSDYNNRVSSTPSPATFVFATPRRWAKGAAWAKERKNEGNFADVRVVDADDLESWLLTAPSAHYWISEHLGFRPRDAVSLDKWWERFSASTKPQLPADLFLSGRRQQSDQLIKRLQNEPVHTLVQSEWADDCLGFLHASLSLASGGENITTAIVVSSADAWDSILEKPGRALLIPRFDGADVGRAINQGHHIVSVVDRSAFSRRKAEVSLPRLGRRDAADALRGAGVEPSEAERLAVLGRKSLPALCRRISLNPTISRPEWTNPPDAGILAALVLAGAWTTSSDDIAMLESMANQPWSVIEPLLGRMSTSVDPVVRKVGTCWSFVSQEEAFLLLQDSVTTDLVERSVRVAEDVVSEADPVLDLTPEEQSTAGLLGVKRRYSGMLREGLAQGLALLGSLGGEVELDNGVTAAVVAARTVRRLIERASEDDSGRRWHELAAVLPMLAEAAPDTFLDALEEDLSHAEPAVVSLFEEHSDSLRLGPTSMHHHLLWALESLCWSTEHIIDGVRVLARLCCLDPGGKSGNRPLESMTSILSGWVRHTSATREQRLQALDAVYRIADEIGWSLTFQLLPHSGRILIPPADPRFRDWKPTELSVPVTNFIQFVHDLVDRAVQHADSDPERLAQLAEALPSLPPHDRTRVVELLARGADHGLIDDQARLLLWERLRSLTAFHEQYASADWALPADVVGRLCEIASALESDSDPQRFAYLFDWHPDIPGVDRKDFNSYQAELGTLRTSALLSILKSDAGIGGVEALARRSAVPGQLGWVLGGISEVGLRDVLPWLSSSESALEEAGSMWVRRRIQLGGASWFIEALSEHELEGAAREIVIRNAPSTEDVLQALRDSSVAADETTYWEKASFDVVPSSFLGQVVVRLLDHGRIWTAIAVLADAIERTDLETDCDFASVARPLIVTALNGALNQPSAEEGPSSMTTYCIGSLLDFLAMDDDFEMKVASYEFTFFRILEHHREPTTLNRVLATRPDQFVELVTHAYRGRQDRGRELSDADQSMATQAWWVLHQWKGFPGRRDDGSLDGAVMASWVRAARLALADVDRSDVGDEMVGQALSHSPVGADGAWPAEPVRDILEAIGSRDLENGFLIGRMNARGATWRGLYDGGTQERELAENYRDWSATTRAKWPRTARILRDIAESYERDARREDTKAELDADRS